MSKYQEALERIFPPKYFNNIFPQFIGITTSLRIERKDFETIKELVNKETPMKANKQTNKEKVYLNDVSYVYEDVVLGKCPNCETYLHEENEYGDIINYCPYCGQKIDWSDSE